VRSSRPPASSVAFNQVNALIQRDRDHRPLFGLPPLFDGPRWVSRDGGPDDLALAHGKPRPDPSPLVRIGTMPTRFDDSWRVDVHGTLGTILILAARSGESPAFRSATRDQAEIERELATVPGREAWRPFEIDVDGVRTPFQRQDRAGDWIAFHDLRDECLYVHVEQADGSPVSIVTITDITPYVEDGSDEENG
jgi:hypothetical protein